MTPQPQPPPDLRPLGRAVADALPDVAPDRLARQRARVAGLAPSAPRRAAPAVAVGLGLAAAAGLVARLATRPDVPAPAAPPGLTARAGAAPVAVGQWIAAADAPLTLRFSDGSEVTLSPGAHARVVSLDAQGARVLVERGRAEAAVRHADRTRWVFSAGPYAVQVTGTRFAVTWAPERARFDLAMREGSVTLRGPRCAEGLAVQGRDEVHADVAAGTLTVGPAPREVALGPVPQEPIPAGPVPQEPIPAPPRPTPARVRSGHALAPAVAAAHAPSPAAVVPAAPSEPAPTADAASLLAEADAALRAHEHLRARELLMGLRARFPGAPESTRAAFSLGVASLALGAPAVAAGWFERYLREAPSGALASEARGRRAEALRAAGDTAGARAAAEDYLLHDPDGAFAPVARGILRP
ncbi:MAG: FecR domain-containing protein [Polyangiales bacterium]